MLQVLQGLAPERAKELREQLQERLRASSDGTLAATLQGAAPAAPAAPRDQQDLQQHQTPPFCFPVDVLSQLCDAMCWGSGRLWHLQISLGMGQSITQTGCHCCGGVRAGVVGRFWVFLGAKFRGGAVQVELCMGRRCEGGARH